MSERQAIERIARASSARAGRKGTRFRVESLQWDGIRERPSDLAESAGVSLDVYALARLTRSENATDGPAYALAVCEAGRNEARRRAKARAGSRDTWSPAGNLLHRTSGRFAATRGHFGRQRGRWAATLLDPRVKDVQAAKEALAGSNIARGATKFFSPKAQDGGKQGGLDLRRDAMGVVNEWGRGGNRWVGEIPGIDPYRLMLLINVGRPASAAELKQMRGIVERGRRGVDQTFPLGGGPAIAGPGGVPDLRVRGFDGEETILAAGIAGGLFLV